MSNSCQNVNMRGKEEQEEERGRVPVELRLDERATALLLRAGRGTGRNASCCLQKARWWLGRMCHSRRWRPFLDDGSRDALGVEDGIDDI